MSARLPSVAAVSGDDKAVSGDKAAAAVTSRAQTASACPPTDRRRTGTDDISISTPAAAPVAWIALDTEKLTSNGVHPRRVQKGCYPLKVVELYLDVSCSLSATAQLGPFRPAQLLIRDEEEAIDRRLLHLSLSKVTSELVLYLPKVPLPPRKVHGGQASAAIPRAQDVCPAVRPSKGVTRIDGLVAIEQQELCREPLRWCLAICPLMQSMPGLVPSGLVSCARFSLIPALHRASITIRADTWPACATC